MDWSSFWIGFGVASGLIGILGAGTGILLCLTGDIVIGRDVDEGGERDW